MGKRAYLDLYTSWAVAGRGGVVRGRALEGERPELGDHDDNLLERAWNTFELIETDEIPGVDVDVALFDEAASTPLRQLRVVTNDEGFFEAAVPATDVFGRPRP